MINDGKCWQSIVIDVFVWRSVIRLLDLWLVNLKILRLSRISMSHICPWGSYSPPLLDKAHVFQEDHFWQRSSRDPAVPCRCGSSFEFRRCRWDPAWRRGCLWGLVVAGLINLDRWGFFARVISSSSKSAHGWIIIRALTCGISVDVLKCFCWGIWALRCTETLLVCGLEHFFPYIGIIIPIDFHIFQRGSNHQPV